MSAWGSQEEYEPKRCDGYGPELVRLANGQNANFLRTSAAGGELWAACQCNNGTCAGIDIKLSAPANAGMSAMLMEIVQTLKVVGPPL